MLAMILDHDAHGLTGYAELQRTFVNNNGYCMIEVDQLKTIGAVSDVQVLASEYEEALSYAEDVRNGITQSVNKNAKKSLVKEIPGHSNGCPE